MEANFKWIYRNGLCRPTLYQLIPKRELKLPQSHIVLGRIKADHEVVDAICLAVGGNPTTGDAGAIFEKLFEQVVLYLSRRQTHGRTNFWRAVQDGWQSTSGVVLHVTTIRELVLAITLAERKWDGTRSSNAREFLRYVRMANDFFRQLERESDEAMEIIAEAEVMKRTHNVFCELPEGRIPWTTFGRSANPGAPDPSCAQPHDSEQLSTAPLPDSDIELSDAVDCVMPKQDKRVRAKSVKPVNTAAEEPLLTRTQKRNRLRNANKQPDIKNTEKKKAQKAKLAAKTAANRAAKKLAKKLEKKKQREEEEAEARELKELEDMLVAAFESDEKDGDNEQDGTDEAGQLQESEASSTGSDLAKKRHIETAEEDELPAKNLFTFDLVVGRTRPEACQLQDSDLFSTKSDLAKKRPRETAEEDEPPRKKCMFDLVVGRTRPAQP
ncbi:hypothetical protein CONLIGDRAFT_648400 [Coniochaeta ligniaria NRRL 30616]|uniref:Uncharacterized protein n=1 Tax=Coniochaeta ligniaria NRRL 30616 TaxID=1408157 RepID=A0A1J7ICD2_9PEZI|nr:hypothetical protein CONLIGDRAFT_648400 [Coniochaeta ligniaria NRRL 30616]